ncbi:MAG TPA: hypothetical protein VGJ20_24250 [Xanthobacteraceae bacterium]|jgi:hypothetical protein
MQKVRGLFLASIVLCVGGAQAAPVGMRMSTVHRLNPQPLPPGAAYGTGGGAGKVGLTDIASPKLNTTRPRFHNGTHMPMHFHNGTHIPK